MAMEAEQLLEKAVDASVTVHETWALHRERRGIELYQLSIQPPAGYAEAERALADLEAALSDPPARLREYAIRSCIEAAMNIPLPDGGLSSPIVIDKLLGEKSLLPDERLARVTARLKDAGGFPADAWRHLYQAAGLIRQHFGLEAAELEELLLEASRLSLPGLEKFRRVFIEVAAAVLDDELLALADFPFLPVAKASEALLRFWGATVSAAADAGVILPPLVKYDASKHSPLDGCQFDVDYQAPSWFSGAEILFDGSPAELVELLRRLELYYVAWVDQRVVRFLPIEVVDALRSDTPADVAKNAARHLTPEALVVRATNERIGFQMPPERQLAVIEALGDRVLAAVVEALPTAKSLHTSLGVAAALSSTEHERLGVCAVFGGRVSTGVSMLRRVHSLEVERLHRVFVGDRDDWTAALIGERAILLFRVPREVPGMLRAHDREIYDWWQSAVADTDDPRLQPAYAVAVIERLGGFAIQSG